MSKKLTYEFVKEQFEKEGYELLSKEYISANSKLKYRCPKGHEHNITWANWQQEYRCPICAADKHRTKIEAIKASFESCDYELLTTEYINNQQKLRYICPDGHKHSVTWNDWQQGHRCSHCAGNARKTIELIKPEFEKENWILKSIEYVNNKQKLDCVCPNKHKHKISWNMWQKGRRCPICAGIARKTLKDIKSEFEKADWILEPIGYVNNKQKLDCICPKGHKCSISWHVWRRGYGCPKCGTKISKGELEVRDFVKSLGIEVSANNRNQIFNPDTGRNFELDIFIPEFNRAIEYNGEYWHNSEERKNCDDIKRQLCELGNIGLLTVWENEWKTQTRICKNKIKEFIFD